MNLPYGLRLLLLSAASYFVVYCAASLVICAVAPAIVSRPGVRVPRRAAASIALLRLLPLLLALFTVAAVCIPGYLEFEPEAGAERAGVLSILAAASGLALFIYGLARACRALQISLRNARELRASGRQIQLAGEATTVTVLDTEVPVAALSGITRPRVVISRGLLEALSHEQLEAALRHEQAHRAAGDNWKRLLFLAAPDPFAPLGSFAQLERAWARVAEWSADDRASTGNPQRALALAEALVRVARMGNSQRPCPIAAQLLDDRGGLCERVRRLLEFAGLPERAASGRGDRLLPMFLVAGALLLGVAWQTPLLYSAHLLLEFFMR